MSAAYKLALLVSMATLPFSALPQYEGRDNLLAGNCSDIGECVVFLNTLAPTKNNLCDSPDFSAFWTKGTERYLVQCRSGETAEDSVVWIVDRRSGLFRRLDYGRFINKSALEKNPNMIIPDKFASRGLCSPIDPPKLRASDFVLLDKKPTDDDEKPYCYEPTYLTIEGRKLSISANRRPAKRSDSDRAVHEVPARDRVRLIHLLDAVRNWRPQDKEKIGIKTLH